MQMDNITTVLIKPDDERSLITDQHLNQLVKCLDILRDNNSFKSLKIAKFICLNENFCLPRNVLIKIQIRHGEIICDNIAIIFVVY